jgi:hypothetical protein
MGHWGYLVALVLIVAAFLIARRGGGNRIRVRDNSGMIIGGDVSGTVTQNVQAAPPPAPGKPDRVVWAIGIVAAMIAAAQLIHDILTTK